MIRTYVFMGCFTAGAIGIATFLSTQQNLPENKNSAQVLTQNQIAKATASVDAEQKSEPDSPGKETNGTEPSEALASLEGTFHPAREGLGYDNSYEDLLFAERGDEEAEKKFAETLARSIPEKKFFTDQAPYVHRRKLVKQTTSFREIAQALMSGRDIPVLSLPDFDGKTLDVKIEKTNFISPNSGSFVGRIEGDPLSLVSLAFHNGSDAAEIYIPSQERRLNFQPYDDSLTVLLDIDTVKMKDLLAHSHDEEGLIPESPGSHDDHHGHHHDHHHDHDHNHHHH